MDTVPAMHRTPSQGSMPAAWPRPGGAPTEAGAAAARRDRRVTFTTEPPELIAHAAEVPDEPAKAAAADVAAAADEAAPADLLQRHPRMSFTPAQLQEQEMAEREAFPMGWGQLSPEAQAAEMERIKAMPVPDDGECEDDTEDSEAAAAGVEAAGGPSKPGDDRAGPPEDHEPTHEPDGEPEVAPPPPPGRPPANRPAAPGAARVP